MATDLDILKAGTFDIIPEKAFDEAIQSGKKLRIKLGMDPTAPDLHLGHAVVLSKLRDFQDQGHEIILLIGDFTARIGDPTGRSKTRPPLTDKDIAHNMQTYFDQAGRILDINKVQVRHNSEWLGALTSSEWITLCAHVTLARITERDDFAKRIKANQPIGLHELLYPVLQGYDSVALASDVELGGTDQTFNLLMGRFMQEQYGQKPQVIITMPFLEGLDGIEKMSKSLGNAIGLTEPANDVFGKIMSISDALMWRYYTVLLHKSDADIEAMQANVATETVHPKTYKKQLAHAIISRFWSEQEADEAQSAFEQLFEQKSFAHAQEVSMPETNPIRLLDLVKLLGAAASSSEARRLITGGAVTIDDVKRQDPYEEIMLQSGMPIRIGKHRFYRIV